MPAFLLLLSCKQQATVYAVRKDIIETIYASGRILADSEYTVYALNAGTVVRKMVREGDTVSRGQVLMIIRNTAPVARLSAANTLYAHARQNLTAGSRILNELKIATQNADLKYTNDSLLYSRYQKLWTQNIGTKVNLDNAQTQCALSLNQKKAAREQYYATINDLQVDLKNARSQAVNARADLDNYFIRAESSGTVYQTMKEKGEAVKMNEPVVLMGRSRARLIRLAVDQQDIDRIRPGQTVLLKTDVTGDRVFKARVMKTFPVMNEADQTFRVDATFLSNDTQPYIHSSVEANIIIQIKRQCLVVPSAALYNGDSLHIDLHGRKVAIAVKTGIHSLNEVEITGGIDGQLPIYLPLQK